MPAPSPKITRLGWGSVETEVGRFRDVKLWPGGGRSWDWRETGTDHTPGIRPADPEELLANGARVVILGRGRQGRLRVMEETLARIREGGAIAEVLETEQAVERYNELAERGEPVGALIHTTC